jgi:hypothetical protein
LRRAGGHIVARRDERTADAAADRRLDHRELTVQRCRLHGGLGRRAAGLRLGVGGRSPFVLLGRDGLLGREPLRPLGLAAGQGFAGLRQLQLGAGALQCCVERPRVDAEQRLPGPDVLAFLEQHRLDVSCHTGPQIDALRSLHAPHMRHGLLEGALQDGRHHDRRRRRRGIRRVTAGWQAVSTAAASSEAVAMKATRRVGDGIDPRRERKAGMGGLLE